MSKPVISVVIPLYNHEKYIESCLLSVLNQSYQDFEIIIINDGSTDRSEEVVKTVRDNRIRYVYQTNQGAAETINRGIRLGRENLFPSLIRMTSISRTGCKL